MLHATSTKLRAMRKTWLKIEIRFAKMLPDNALH